MSFLRKSVGFVANAGVLAGGIAGTVAVKAASAASPVAKPGLVVAEFAIKEATKKSMEIIWKWADD